MLFALSDPTRLAIARALADGEEHSAGDLAGDVPKSTMSHHLKILREAGITSTRPEGMRCRVSLRRAELNRRFPGLLAAISEECRGVGSQLRTYSHSVIPGSRAAA